MKVQEFINFMNENKKKNLSDNQFDLIVSKKLNVKKYLPIKEKISLIDEIIEDSIMYDSGIFYFDEIKKYIVFTMKVISAYTDIEISDYYEDYDLLCEKKLLNVIISFIDGEYDNFLSMLTMKTDEILNKNNTNYKINQLLDGLNTEGEKILKKISDFVKNFDFSKFNIDEKTLNILKDLK